VSEKSEYFECYSQELSRIYKKIPREEVTIRDFLDLMGEQGRLITCMVLSTPFLIPVSIPGTGILAGFIIFLISISIMFDRDYLIPNRFLNYKISRENLVKILNLSLRLLIRLENYMKPRLLIMTTKTSIRNVNRVLMIFSSMLFMLPLPIPLTDTLPASCVFFLAVGTLEHDGYMILVSYLAVLITLIYFGSVILLSWSGLSFLLSYL
jgi:hypothetical protein